MAGRRFSAMSRGRGAKAVFAARAELRHAPREFVSRRGGRNARREHGGARNHRFPDVIGQYLTEHGAQVLGVTAAARGLTVELDVQVVGGADLDRPVDATVQITRETGRFLFVRGTVEQGGDMAASFMGILRKPGR